MWTGEWRARSSRSPLAAASRSPPRSPLGGAFTADRLEALRHSLAESAPRGGRRTVRETKLDDTVDPATGTGVGVRANTVRHSLRCRHARRVLGRRSSPSIGKQPLSQPLSNGSRGGAASAAASGSASAVISFLASSQQAQRGGEGGPHCGLSRRRPLPRRRSARAPALPRIKILECELKIKVALLIGAAARQAPVQREEIGRPNQQRRPARGENHGVPPLGGRVAKYRPSLSVQVRP
mmetsp:Transcript_18978/g.60621  ORF Transcript_18978/g.60621 Transcript_18978/m.60621 type:complete len:238 (+) Transcript_18978:651-1364(+)